MADFSRPLRSSSLDPRQRSVSGNVGGIVSSIGSDDSLIQQISELLKNNEQSTHDEMTETQKFRQDAKSHKHTTKKTRTRRLNCNNVVSEPSARGSGYLITKECPRCGVNASSRVPWTIKVAAYHHSPCSWPLSPRTSSSLPNARNASQAMDLCFLQCLRDAVWLLRIAHVELISRLLCSSVKSMKISAAQCPEKRKPIVVHLSI